MADVNGSTVESKSPNVIKTEIEESTDKPAPVNGGGGDNAGVPTAEDKKPVIVKDEKPVLEPELLAKKIKRQIEYYFGDYNLPSDKFMKEQIKLKDGWISLQTLLTFRRLSALTSDPAVILSSIEGSDLVQISEDKTELRRTPDKPLPVESEARRKEVLTRSLYVKGFPLENFTIYNALDFFEQYGPTDDVVMRNWHDKAEKSWKFKGSVFVVFPTKEAAAAFLALEDVKAGEEPLIRMWQEEYIEQKRKERLDLKMAKRKPSDNKYNNPKRVKEEDHQPKGLPKNATLHITNCPEDLMREKVKEKVEEMGVTVAFIDFNKGDDKGWIRLHEADTAPKVISQCEGGILKLKDGVELEIKALEGEEEESFLASAQQSIDARRARGNNKHRGGRRGGGRGHRGGHWGKRRNDGAGGPPGKMFKREVGGSDDD